MKNNFKNYKFWLAVLAAVIVLINALGAVFNFSVNEVAITSIATAVLGVFVALGLVNKNSKEENENVTLEKDKTKSNDDKIKTADSVENSSIESQKQIDKNYQKQNKKQIDD